MGNGLSSRKVAAIALSVSAGALGSAAHGANFTFNGNQAAGTNYTAAIWQPGSVSPASGNTYQVTSPGLVRNPDNGNVAGTTTFPGDSLTLDTGAQLRFKDTAGQTVNFPGVGGAAGLILNGGTLNVGDPATFVVGGVMLVQAPSFLDDTSDAARTFTIDAKITGSAQLTLQNAINTIPLSITNGSNTFSGAWNITQGFLKGTNAGSLGSGDITIASGAVFETNYDLNNPSSKLSLSGLMNLHQNDTFNLLTINGTPVAPGTYSYTSLKSSFPANFSATGSGQITVLTPEPGSAALGGVTICGLLLRRRRGSRR